MNLTRAYAWCTIGLLSALFGIIAHNPLGLIIGFVSAGATLYHVVETKKEDSE